MLTWQKDLEAEIKRLKLELKQSMEMYNFVTKEAVATRGKVRERHNFSLQ